MVGGRTAPAPAQVGLRVRDWALALLLTCAALALRLWGLGSPEEPYFDEVYYVKAAKELLAGELDSNTVHPPLGKIQIAAGIWLGDRLAGWLPGGLPEPTRWRLASVAAGVAAVPLTFWLGFRLSGGQTAVAGLAGALVAIDFMHVVVSRIAMLDSFVAFWILVGSLFAWRYLEVASEDLGAARGAAFGAALAFGAATACKWNGLFGASGAALAMVALARPRRRAGQAPLPLERWWLPPLAMAVCIPSVYAVSYLPLFVHEGTLGAPAWERIVGYHKLMLSFRYDSAQFTHPYLSAWWTWPLVYRPVWWFYRVGEGGTVRGIVALGSVVFWWSAFLYLFELSVRAVRGGDRALWFLALTWLPQWLLWASSTTGGFPYYLVTLAPWMGIAAGTVLTEWWQTGGRWLTSAYLIVLLVCLACYLPFLLGLPATQEHFARAFPAWLPSWR